MTQQGDARNPSQTDQSQAFVFQGNTGSGSGSHSGESEDNNNDNNNGKETIWDRWPLLLSLRQVVTAFVLETMTNAQPLRDK